MIIDDNVKVNYWGRVTEYRDSEGNWHPRFQRPMTMWDIMMTVKAFRAFTTAKMSKKRRDK